MSGSTPTAPTRSTGRLPEPERRKRNRQIAEARDAGASWADVAERFGLSERQARRAYIDYLRAAGQLLDLNQADALREILQVHVWALEELRVLAASADNDSAKVGAVRSRVSVSHDLLKLLVAAGIIPSGESAFLLRVEADKRRFADAVLYALERRGIDFHDLEADLDRALRAEPAEPAEVAA